MVSLFEVFGISDHLSVLPPQDHGSGAALDVTLEGQGPPARGYGVTEGH